MGLCTMGQPGRPRHAGPETLSRDLYDDSGASLRIEPLHGVLHELRKHVRTQIGPIATPRQIMIVPELPKTRSGKIMRRLLKDVAEQREVGDVTTLADSSVMDLIPEGLGKGRGED